MQGLTILLGKNILYAQQIFCCYENRTALSGRLRPAEKTVMQRLDNRI